MRLLHTSDWHLGITLEGMPMLEFQRQAIDHILDVVRGEGVDAVLISGDIYDRSLPSVDAVRVFEDALVRIGALCPVVVTSGNHDSAVRLGFGSRLYADQLHLRTAVDRLAEPVVLEDEYGPVHIYGIPYLDPDLTRHALGGEPLERSHEAVIGAAMDRIRADLARCSEGSVRSVVMAHAFITGASASAERSDSERDIRVGNVDAAPATVFAGVDYTALGHLHGPQQPRSPGPGVVRYSGSPLRYSFSEATHTKSVTLVDLGPDGVKSVSTVDIPQPRPMAELSGTFAELIGEDRFAPFEESWLKLTVTDPVRPERMHAALRERYPHLVVSFHTPAATSAATRFVDTSSSIDPMEVVAAFLQEAQGEAASMEQLEAARREFEAVLGAGRSA